MFEIKSIFSQILKRTTGIPEVNLNKNPITDRIVSNMQEGPMRDLLKQFPRETLQLIVKIANDELKNK